VTDLAAFLPALRRVQLLVLDVDGVLTDGRLYYGPRGETLKVFDVKDGHGIKQVAAAGIGVAIITGRKSPIVTRRARELGIRHVTQGAADKQAALTRLAKARAVPLEHCACVGDDTPDAAMMRISGLAIAVANAHADALAVAHLVTRQPGGRGAVREVCDWLLDARRAGRTHHPGVRA
jgi:3-deoxy-D-manno-octulosonate 8-phosphate phosphatase (KDO 8-P phosphatase)